MEPEDDEVKLHVTSLCRFQLRPMFPPLSNLTCDKRRAKTIGTLQSVGPDTSPPPKKKAATKHNNKTQKWGIIWFIL